MLNFFFNKSLQNLQKKGEALTFVYSTLPSTYRYLKRLSFKRNYYIPVFHPEPIQAIQSLPRPYIL